MSTYRKIRILARMIYAAAVLVWIAGDAPSLPSIGTVREAFGDAFVEGFWIGLVLRGLVVWAVGDLALCLAIGRFRPQRPDYERRSRRQRSEPHF